MLQLLFRRRLALALMIALSAAAPAGASELCPDEQATEQLPPADPAFCAELDPVIRKPSALPLEQYEAKLNDFIGHYCHRRLESGWKMDKTVRDAGPFFGTLTNGVWSGSEQATHMPVLIWYSPEMMAWLKKYRPAAAAPALTAPVPDGAIMIKEMYNSTPAAACQVPDLLKLKPVEQGAAVMIRDSGAAKDGWFWGWYGWPDVKSGWSVDYPPAGFGLPFMGFGQYCVNCHASARDNQTFASLDNIKGEHGNFLAFLSQGFYQTQSFGIQPPPHGPEPGVAILSEHLEAVQQAHAPASTALKTLPPSNMDFMASLNLGQLPALAQDAAARTLKMPSQTYDNVWVPGHGSKAAHAFVTADQCVGCHSAGGTGLQFEMTAPVQAPSADSTATLFNFSPYGTWRTSPMGLAGRDPIFFGQLASETQTFHPTASELVQNTCLGCHGIEGQRQFSIDTPKPGGACPDFRREMVDAVPFPSDNSQASLAHFGGLARDGVSCAACHHMVLGKADTARFAGQPQNRCVEQRQDLLNADNKGFARTFTGSFFIGDPDTLYGPYEDPKKAPMNHAFGAIPEHSRTIKASEVCGTCHTVHLPVFSGTDVVAHSYEQTTYPEWAFSAYRTGATPDGKLPFGAGTLAQSCQDCHMPSADSAGVPFRSKIAGIQEHSNFPAAENALGAAEIDLPVRTGVAKHVLVGLNVFFIEMAKQFNTVLGIPTADPMLGKKGVPPLDLTEQAMLDQASSTTATIKIGDTSLGAEDLRASVTIANLTGHKFPSGVGFRRAFVDFTVSDAAGAVLWESGRTNRAGVLVDQNGQPIAGEFWWKDDCSGTVNTPGNNPHQPHYREIAQQDQVQIFQELVTAPPPDGPQQCGHHAPASGPLTTSFLSVCGTLKDNRLLPDGFLPLDQRIQISHALGAGDDMAEDAGAIGTGDDPAYVTGGGDTFAYHVPLKDLPAPPAKISATLYYQAIPPFYLQDRFCTAKGTDADRLRFVTSELKLDDTRAAQWKLNLVSTGPVAVR
jgi:cytochrome c553